MRTLPAIYGSRANPATGSFPQGSYKDETTPGANDGTPLTNEPHNDLQAFIQRALNVSGVTPDGTPDTVSKSQIYNAVILAAIRETLGSDQYTGPNSTFNTFASMVAATFQVGDIAETKGYYSAADGGGSTYIIVDAADFTGTPDGFGNVYVNGTDAVAVIVTNGEINSRQFGAQPSESVNQADRLNAMADVWRAMDNGKCTIAPGRYFVNETFAIVNDGTNTNATTKYPEMEASDVTIISSLGATTPTISFRSVRQCKFKGLAVEGLSGTQPYCGFYGFWRNTWEQCDLNNVTFGDNPSGNFRDAYWNKFDTCRFRQITLQLGTASVQNDFNGNLFTNCTIQSGEYAFDVYGSRVCTGNTFVSCDISYQTQAALRIDEEILGGSFNFVGGYWDSSAGMPLDTKNLHINSYGAPHASNSANLASGFFDEASGQHIEQGISGVRIGSRVPTSSVNYLINGDLAAGDEGIEKSGAGTVDEIVTGSGGYYDRFYRYATSGARTIRFVSIEIPMDGWYSLTSVARVNSGTVSTGFEVNGSVKTANPVQIGSEWTLGSYQTKLNQGDIVKFTISPNSGQVEVMFAALTPGRFGNMLSQPHIDADLSLFGGFKRTLSNDGPRIEYSTQSVADSGTTIETVSVPNFGRASCKVVAHGSDGSSPAGSFYGEWAVAMHRNGTGAVTVTIAEIVAVRATFTSDPSLSFTQPTNGQVNLVLSSPSGSGSSSCKISVELVQS